MDSNQNGGINSTLKIIAAYGLVLKISKRHHFCNFLADRQKSGSLYDYDTLYKVWMNRMEIGRGAEFYKIGNFAKRTE